MMPYRKSRGWSGSWTCRSRSDLNYGKFIRRVVDFLIIAFAIFLMVQGNNSFKRKEEAAAAVPTATAAH